LVDEPGIGPVQEVDLLAPRESHLGVPG
jgi:hypothetical protein